MQTINNWQVMETYSVKAPSKNRPCSTQIRYKAMCTKCNHISDISKQSAHRSKGSCTHCIRNVSQPYGDITKKYMRNIVKNAMRKPNLPFDIDMQYLHELFIKQNKRCVYTGRELCFTLNYGSNSSKQTASLDRIDSSKGYTKDNVQWVHKAIQPMKGELSHTDFLALCAEIHANTTT